MISATAADNRYAAALSDFDLWTSTMCVMGQGVSTCSEMRPVFAISLFTKSDDFSLGFSLLILIFYVCIFYSNSLGSDTGEHIRRAMDSPLVNLGREILGLEPTATPVRTGTVIR